MEDEVKVELKDVLVKYDKDYRRGYRSTKDKVSKLLESADSKDREIVRLTDDNELLRCILNG